MEVKVYQTELKNIQPFRTLFLQEMNVQIRYNARHERGWADSWLLTVNELAVGYGSVAGREKTKDRDIIFEYYIIPPFRKFTTLLFSELLSISGVNHVECQTNDSFFFSLFCECTENSYIDTILFQDYTVTALYIADALFRRRRGNEAVFKHEFEPPGDYVLEWQGEVVATGGFLLHYNIPFADLYMEVRPDCRRKGFGSFLIQELKKECYLSGRVPAARTSIHNQASKATLLKAGMKVAGYMVTGTVK